MTKNEKKLRKYQRRAKYAMICFICCLILIVLGAIAIIISLNQPSSVSTLRRSGPNPDTVFSLIFVGISALLFLIMRGYNGPSTRPGMVT